MYSEIREVKNKLQPHSPDNKDAIQFDYSFWTDLEKLAKKHRKTTLDELCKLSKDPDKVGTILRGALFKTVHKQSNPRRTFDLETFLDHLRTHFPEIPAYTLRELATKSVVDGNRSNSYTVEDANDD